MEARDGSVNVVLGPDDNHGHARMVDGELLSEHQLAKRADQNRRRTVGAYRRQGVIGRSRFADLCTGRLDKGPDGPPVRCVGVEDQDLQHVVVTSVPTSILAAARSWNALVAS